MGSTLIRILPHFSCMANTNLLIMAALTFLTWNVTGIMSSSSYLSDILNSKSVDICGIAEHWLYEHDHHFMDCINSQYTCYTKSDVDLRLPGNRRVGKGGVALLWNKRLCNSITPIHVDDHRIIGVQYEMSRTAYMYIFKYICLQVITPLRYSVTMWTLCIMYTVNTLIKVLSS